MDESELKRSLHDLDQRMQTGRDPKNTRSIRANELEGLVTASQRRRSRLAAVSVAAMLLTGICIGLRLQMEPPKNLEPSITNATELNLSEASELDRILQDSERLVHTTQEYLANFQSMNTDTAEFVDDASVVSLAIAQHYLAEGLVDESRRELETLVRLLPLSIGGKEAVKELAAMDAT